MILQVLAVYDSKARAFLPPFTVSHIDIGRRAFADSANNPEHQLCKNPEDFSLWHLGTFNDENANFELVVPVTNLGNALTYKKAPHVPN